MRYEKIFSPAKTKGVVWLVATLLSCLYCAGCDSDEGSPLVLALQPLYTTADLDTDARLLGCWTDQDGEVTFIFEPGVERNYKLKVIQIEAGREFTGEFTASLVRLGSDWFLDLYPNELQGGSDFFQWHFLRTHTFIRIEIDSDSLSIACLSGQWLRKRLEDKSVDTPHEVLHGAAVLTGTTWELQDLVYRYAHSGEAFADPLNLTWQKEGTE